MKRGRIALVLAVAVVAVVLLAAGIGRDDAAAAPAEPTPVLSVSLTRPRVETLPVRVPASGSIVAWQEASIGADTEALRLTEVRVNVGDDVRRGQVLATFDPALVEADAAEAAAAVAVAQAESLEAAGNARRAEALDGSGAMSRQQIEQYLAAAAVARARLDAARATEQRQRKRLAQTRVLAPSDGVITARSATVGAVVPAGQELFRMIKDGRLEWRAAVAVADLDALAPGQDVRLQVPGHGEVRGTLRMVAPDIDTQTRSGLVYVDLPRSDALRAGAFVTGHVDVREADTLTLPLGAVLLRDGFHYVMRVGPASEVVAKKVVVGRRTGDRIEIASGLAATDAVIAAGLGFLNEGDTVRVVEAARERAEVRVSAVARSNAEALARSAP
ncbi:efflux RND transporter periplasmic adaptor subunit [Pseudoxanthomonas sp. PXM02]|uniref:efflux RND transporter periplasmic adaptor subunit n=1 Tax=Pseudoxanthomonas sp. PXM02 TaxID=2769294 RepID=UPI001784BC11|nr:efflux RND transporter periplasmic adaptor subunit [Pseudoxanthomonas sp. PXM02]MBD9478119.1 efflux RND transporter periplasmic adaptor subunit [Pseudoxanthomonas sp. PXM02]